jgi:hypothetical protein
MRDEPRRDLRDVERDFRAMSALLAFVPLWMGCQQPATPTGSTSENAETGEQTVGPSSGSETASTASGQTDSSAQDSTGAGSSESGEDPCSQPSGDQIQLRLVNQTGGPLFFDAYVQAPEIALRIDGVLWPKPVCTPSCEQAIGGTCEYQPCDISVLRVESGGSFAANWDNTQWFSSLAHECAPASCADVECSKPSLAGEGSFTLAVRASDLCLNAGGGCNCAPNADGWCVGEANDVPGATSFEASQEFVYPTDVVVEVVIE